MKIEESKEKPGLRYETCRDCGLRWNIAKEQNVPKSGYVCPRCREKARRG